MTTTLAALADSLLFEQHLDALHRAPARHAESDSSAIGSLLDRFILGLAPADALKPARFEALASCPRFDANHRIAPHSLYAIPGSGVPHPVQRPMEFAICQFLAAGADANWARAIVRMAASPLFEGSLQRPLLFTKVLLMQPPPAGLPADGGGGGGGSACEPIVHHQKMAAFASTFLMQEAARFDGPARLAILDLARLLQLRMEPRARSLADQELFLFLSLGPLARASVEGARALLLAGSRIAPLAPPPLPTAKLSDGAVSRAQKKRH